MTALWVLLGILAVLALLWFLPLKLFLRYDQSGGSVTAKIGPKSIPIYPRPPAKPKKEKKKRKKKEETPEPEEPEPDEAEESSGLGGKLPLFQQLLALGLEALDSLTRHLTVTELDVHLFAATIDHDPAAAALKYGAGWSAVGALVPFLERHLDIRRRSMDVSLDTNASEDRILASGTLHIFLGELIHLMLHYGIRGLRIYRATKKKGGKRNGTSNQ